eukprot:1179594-Prorocentrum_minimum.AAC.5
MSHVHPCYRGTLQCASIACPRGQRRLAQQPVFDASRRVRCRHVRKPIVASSSQHSAIQTSRAEVLRRLLQQNSINVVPACYDALSAKLVEEAGFDVTFMSGYGVAASRLGLPDAGLISYSEMEDQCRNICRATSLPVIGDGDTGFGGPANVQMTVAGYAQAGCAAISIEDQTFPKRCTFAKGLQVVSRTEALARLKAALEARDRARQRGQDILVVGRTDCRMASNVSDGLEEALWRCKAFQDAGADIVYFEGPQSEHEMEELNRCISVPTMLAQVERPGTPVKSPAECEALGYNMVLYGLTLLNVKVAATKMALASLKAGEHPRQLVDFDELYASVGFPEYYEVERRFLTVEKED